MAKRGFIMGCSSPGWPTSLPDSLTSSPLWETHTGLWLKDLWLIGLYLLRYNPERASSLKTPHAQSKGVFLTRVLLHLTICVCIFSTVHVVPPSLLMRVQVYRRLASHSCQTAVRERKTFIQWGLDW